MSAFDQAIIEDPSFAEAYNGKGFLLYTEFDEIDQAKEYLFKAIQLDPTLGKAYYNLGRISSLEEDYDRAEDYFQKVIKLDPDNASGHDGLGLMYFDQCRLEEARKEFSTAIKLDPQDVYAFNNRGLVEYNLKNYTEALSDFSTAINFNNKKGQIFENRAKVYFALEEYGKFYAGIVAAEKLGHKLCSASKEKLNYYLKAVASCQEVIDDDEKCRHYLGKAIKYRKEHKRSKSLEQIEKHGVCVQDN